MSNHLDLDSGSASRSIEQVGARIASYRRSARPFAADNGDDVSGTVFSPELIVFGLGKHSGPFAGLDLPSAAAVVTRWRDALIAAADQMPASVREVVSGHDPEGRPLQRPHLAFLPLASVGHPRADGSLVGLAAALPNTLDADEREQVRKVLRRVRELRLGSKGVWKLVDDFSNGPGSSLRSEVWTAHPDGCTHWSTITPATFDRHPKDKDPCSYQKAVAVMIADACLAVGLPRPREVVVTPVATHLGVPPAHVFVRLQRKDGSERRHTHAILVFDEPVCGPVLIGAGRYRGYGACRPLDAVLP